MIWRYRYPGSRKTEFDSTGKKTAQYKWRENKWQLTVKKKKNPDRKKRRAENKLKRNDKREKNRKRKDEKDESKTPSPAKDEQK